MTKIPEDVRKVAEDVLDRYCSHREITAGKQFVGPVLIPIVAQAILDERERCAERFQEHCCECSGGHKAGHCAVCLIATAIRGGADHDKLDQ